MSAFLTLNSLSVRTADQRVLFDDLTLSLGAERVGLVGRNGSGKSTLLRIIAGGEPPASGTVSRQCSIGLLMQNFPPDQTIADALGVGEPIAVLRRVLAGVGTSDDLDRADWALEARTEAALSAVSLGGIALDRLMGSLSGGERTRIGMARLLIERPDMLLLDEPTNNLDAAGRAAIKELLQGWGGGALIASHDRELLEMMDRIAELTPVGVHIVSGGWGAFAAQREAERSSAEAALERAGAAVRRAERTAQRQREVQDRRDKAGRSFAAERV